MAEDRRYAVATAQRARSSTFRNREMAWSEFADWQRHVRRTVETAAEYASMGAAKRSEAKDGPCYVAGYLVKGKRRKGSVASRSMVVLDADRSDADLWADYAALIGCRALMYPTHSSTPAARKDRLVVALSRDVSPDEYVPLALRIAESLGMDRFDRTTFQPERLMYASSVPSDVPFSLLECDGPELDPDEWLASLRDWRDVTCWPTVPGAPEAVSGSRGKAGDPREKQGVIGAFCRTYGVEEAIAEFIPDVYAPCGPHRYTFAGGSTFGGAVVYDDLLLYSNHATDPCATGHAVNAFDMVRIHRFGSDGADDGGTSSPSYKAAADWAAALPDVSLELSRAAVADFDEADAESDDSWMADLAKDRNGVIAPTAGNLELILENDAGLAGKLRRDVETGNVFAVADSLPWREIPEGASQWGDGDDASLRVWLEKKYGICSKPKVDDALSNAADKRPYDPLGAFLDSLPAWDGVPRVETLLIDLMDAEDTPYVRAVTRKAIVGAVARAKWPGCKFDYMLILEGPQGAGKSSLLAWLGGKWFTDSLTLDDIGNPKTAGEKLQGNWICEVAELDGMAKASIERLKAFLSTAEDNYRAAYAHHARKYRRRCIVVGTVNNSDGYLRDTTGNRRFWPVKVPGKLDRRRLGEKVREQVWAEAVALWDVGEDLWLDGDVEAEAVERQREAMESDPREGEVEDYLEALVPIRFDSWELEDREAFWRPMGGSKAVTEHQGAKGLVRREAVSIPEVLHEALGLELARTTRTDSFSVRAMLKRLGWEPADERKRTKAYGRQRVYRRVGNRDGNRDKNRDKNHGNRDTPIPGVGQERKTGQPENEVVPGVVPTKNSKRTA